MRIVGGAFKGLVIHAPAGSDVRPTTDRARESLFNILSHSYQPHEFQMIGTRVLDLCAGTGALGLEALSRGASHVTFVEKNATARAALAHNIRTMKADASSVHVVKGDAAHLPQAPIACGLVFLDPPYADNLEVQILNSAVACGWVKPDAIVVVETMSNNFPEWPETFMEDDRRKYGNSSFSILRFVGKAPVQI